ncbi:MAG: dTDP-glucose 4,6-dehydratase [Methanotrichaceae archaeon]|nr:dTDP-glucose 4,6-dehydratase [Methanotrichaceae archaeon]
MRLIVTGGSGFIGSNFIRYILNNSGHIDIDVTNVDALKYGSNPENLKGLEANGRYSFVQGDIADYALISKIIANADAIVNFAAETHVDRSISTPEPFLQSNVVGTFTVLEALRKFNPKAKFVHISTDEVYGDIVEGSFNEDDALKPSSPYSASKAAADVFVLGYTRTYDLNACITRCTNNYGPCQFPEKLIPKTIIRASLGLKVPLYGTGQNVRDWIHVEDHCQAVEAVMNNGQPGEVYNISSKAEKTNLQVIKTVLDCLGMDDTAIEFVEDRPGHDVRYSLDSTKIRQDLGWRPRHNFEQGVEETVKWYTSNEVWWKNLADEKVLSPAPWKLDW